MIWAHKIRYRRRRHELRCLETCSRSRLMIANRIRVQAHGDQNHMSDLEGTHVGIIR